ncbi:MAG TPA: glycoside hydrolase family 27 protein [Acidobacteriaceae bacterium]
MLALLDSQAQTLAPTPPMGWNSWDAYGLTIDEAQFRANVKVLATLKPYGWQYAVIDEGWYLQDPFASKHQDQKFVYDANGRLIPAVNRFPSSQGNASLKPIADWVHAQGLKFGIHLIRGIPRDSVDRDTPIAGSSFTAKQAAAPSDTCPWNEDNYGIQDNAAGQAWYDSMIGLYAGWGVDFLKVDCISDHTYKESEIKQIHRAIQKTGRPIVLSLSPGPTAIEHAGVVSQNSQMWRITDDHWDVWAKEHQPKPGESEFPFTTHDAFDRLAKWNRYVKSGNWPDDDMLPFGSLTPHPGWGEPRQSRLTHNEERTEFTLWAIARSPLILGANLTQLDDFTRSLLINKQVIAISQQSVKSGPGLPPMRDGVSTPDPQQLWYAETGGPNPKHYLAVFNRGDSPADWQIPWLAFHLADKPHAVFDLWNKKHIPSSKQLHVTLAPHACALYRVE